MSELNRLNGRIERLEGTVPLQTVDRGDDLSQLSDEELDQRWLRRKLDQAVHDGDRAEIEKYQRWVATPWETLIEQFLELDVSFLSSNTDDPSPSIQEGHCIYHFNRTGYRSVIEYIERGQIGIATVQDMRRWLDFVATHKVT